jgi:hypothetical protein
MSGYTQEDEYVPSPWLNELPDEMADILVQTLHSLASACEDRYAQQLRRCWAKRRSELSDPRCPWRHRVLDPDRESSHADQERLIADFHARQLDLFRPQQSWDDEF